MGVDDMNAVKHALTSIQPVAQPFFTIAQMAARHPAFTEPSLRWLVFNRGANGLEKSGALVYLGRRILIDEARFIAYLRTKTRAAA